MSHPSKIDTTTWDLSTFARKQLRKHIRQIWVSAIVLLIALYMFVCLFIYAVTHEELTMTQLFLSLPEIVQPWSWE